MSQSSSLSAVTHGAARGLRRALFASAAAVLLFAGVHAYSGDGQPAASAAARPLKVLLLGEGDEPHSTTALYTSLAYSAYLIATDRTVKTTDPLTAATWLGIGAAVANLTYAVAFNAVVVPAAGSWWRLAGMAVFSAGAFAAMLAGLQRVGAVRNAIIGVMEPLTVAVLAAVFLSEPVTLPVLVGGTLILGGAVIASLIRTTTTAEPNV